MTSPHVAFTNDFRWEPGILYTQQVTLDAYCRDDSMLVVVPNTIKKY